MIRGHAPFAPLRVTTSNRRTLGGVARPSWGDGDVQSEVVEHSLDDEVYQIAHPGGAMIEPWRRRQHDGPGLGDRHEVPEVHKRERRLPGDQQQRAALL